MIFTLTDRQYNVLNVLETDNYLIEQYTTSFLESLTLNVNKKSLNPEKWVEGNYVMCKDKTGRNYWFTITSFEDSFNDDEKKLVCYSGTLDIIKEDAAPISGVTQPFEWYFNKIFVDTGITMGINELAGQTRTLEYTSTDKSNAEMLQFVLNGFDNAEARFDVSFKGSEPRFLRLNVFKHIGLTEPQTLLSDDDDSLTSLTRKGNIDDLGTCLNLTSSTEGISLVGKEYKELDDEGNVAYYSPKADHRIYSVAARDNYFVHLPGKTDGEFDGYINKAYQSEAKTQDALWAAGLGQLKKIDHTILTYEAKGLVSCSLGDNITIVAKTMKPEVMISARVTEFKFNDDDSSKNEYTFTNYVELESSISDMDTLVKELQEKLGVIEAKTKTFATTEQVNTVQGNVDTVNNGLSEIKKEVAGNTADIIEVGKTAVKQETVDLMQKALSDSLKAKTAEVQANLDATKSALQEQANKANELAETRYTEWQEGAAQTATDLAKVTTGLDTLDETVAKNGATLTTTTTAATDALAKAKQALTDAATAQGKADATALTVDKQTGSIEALTTKSNENSTAVAKVAQTAEELAELVATSQTTAEGALTKATEAKTTADGLAVSITKAQTTADSATEAANLAQATADGATTSITKVTTTAEGALKAANTAQSTANGLVATISAAQTTADSAVTKANTAQTTADGIKTAVTKAQTTADGAITKATSAQTTADGLKTTVASAQTAADKANTGLVATDKRVATLELTDKNFDVTIASVKTTAEKGVVDAAKANTGIADTNTKMAKLAVDVDAVELVAANAATKAELKVESDKITIGVKDAKDYATGEIAKVEVHTAYAWSADGSDRFTTVYPGENLWAKGVADERIHYKDDGYFFDVPFYNYGFKVPLAKDTTYTILWDYENLVEPDGTSKLSVGLGNASGTFIAEFGATINKGPSGSQTSMKTKRLEFTTNDTLDPVAYPYLGLRLLRTSTPVPGKSVDMFNIAVYVNSKGINIYTPSPLVDPANAYPHYVGTSLKGSDNPADYTWQLDPAYLSIMSEMALQGKLDNDSFYEALDGKVNTEDFLETQELAQTLSDSFKAFTTETFVAEINKLEERSDGLVVNLNNKLADFSFLTTYIKLGEEGLVIGANDSSLKMLLSKDKLAFIDGGETVAYFTNQSFFINRGAIVQSLQVGSHKMVKLNDDHTIFQFVSAS